MYLQRPEDTGSCETEFADSCDIVSCQVYARSQTQVLCQSNKPSLQPFSCILDSRFETVFLGLGVCGFLFCFVLT